MDLSLGLVGTHVLVTGAAGHIGRAVVKAFLESGANVSACDINQEALLALEHQINPVKDYGIRFQRIFGDFSNENAVKQAFHTAQKRFGLPASVVALAGLDLSVIPRSGVANKSLDAWRRVMTVNLDATFLTAKYWLMSLERQADSIRNSGSEGVAGATMPKNCGFIICGSESGHWGEFDCAEYATSKSAIMGGLLQSLKVESVRVCSSARVNAIAPGPVDTQRFKEECRQDLKQLYKDSQATTAMGKPVPEEAVAKAILFLASENWAGSVHGQTLNVDSGKVGKLVWEEGELDNR